MQDVISYIELVMTYFNVVADEYATAYSSEDGGGTDFVKAVKLIDKTESIYTNGEDAELSGYTIYLLADGSIAKYNRRGKLIALCRQCEQGDHTEYVDTIDTTYKLQNFLDDFSVADVIKAIKNALVERLEALRNREIELKKQFNRVKKLTSYYSKNL